VRKSFFGQKERRFDVDVENLIPNVFGALANQKNRIRKLEKCKSLHK
jgi:hypothetical protein